MRSESLAPRIQRGLSPLDAPAFILACLLTMVLAGCVASEPASEEPSAKTTATEEVEINMENCRTIYFAGGCFWGVEEYFSRIPGVADVVSGYANGTVENPTYEQVCRHTTGHAETVRVTYDPSVISLKTLAEQLFRIVDPLSVNRQGNDVGDQYRTGVYYTDEADRAVVQAVFDAEQAKLDCKIAVELLPLSCFYEAEEYHQDYLKKNPRGYCHISFSSLADVKTEQQLAAEPAAPSSPPTTESLLPKKSKLS